MEPVFQYIQLHFPYLITHVYLFLFIGATIEGLSALVIGGFLVSTHSVQFFPALAVFVLGHTLNGFIWYGVGYYTGAKSLDKWGRNKEKSRKIIERVEHYFNMHSGKAIFLTKFTFSLTVATQIMAGSLKYDFKKFSWYNFMGSACWALFAMSVGYFFGQSYKLLFVYAKDVAIGIIFLGGAIALIYILKIIFQSAFMKSLIMHERLRHYGTRLRSGLDRFLWNGNGNGGVKDVHIPEITPIEPQVSPENDQIL